MPPWLRLARLGAPFGCLWGPFGSLWGPFGSLWAPFGSLWGPFGRLWVPFGSLWVSIWVPLGCPWGSWGPWGAPWAAEGHILRFVQNLDLQFRPDGSEVCSLPTKYSLVEFTRGDPIMREKWHMDCSSEPPFSRAGGQDDGSYTNSFKLFCICIVS